MPHGAPTIVLTRGTGRPTLDLHMRLVTAASGISLLRTGFGKNISVDWISNEFQAAGSAHDCMRSSTHCCICCALLSWVRTDFCKAATSKFCLGPR